MSLENNSSYGDKSVQRSLEELYSEIVNNMTDVVWTTDMNLESTYCTPSVKKVFGYTVAEFREQPLEKLYTPETIANIKEFQKMLRQKIAENNFVDGDEFVIQGEAFKKSGELFYFITNVIPKKNKEGIMTGFLAETQDITKEKIAQNELAESQRKYKIIADNNYNWEYWISPEGDYLYNSPSCKRIIGYSPDELKTDELFRERIADKEGLERYIEHRKHIKSCKSPDKLSFNFRKKSGEIICLEHICQPLFNENGIYIGSRGSNIDITEQKLAVTALLKSEERFRNLVKSQTSYVLRTDLTGKHTYWNDKFVEDFGWIYENTGMDGGESLKSICNYHHARTYETVKACINNPGTIIKIELDKPTQNRGVRTTLWEFVCLKDNNNQPSEIQCMGLDITERRKTELELIKREEQYRSLIDSSDASILMIDEKGTQLFVNEVAAKRIGKTPKEVIESKLRIQDRLPKEEAEKLMTQIRTVIATKKGHVEEVEIKYPDKKNWFRVSYQPVLDESGNAYAVLMNGTDITTNKFAEIQLKESENKYKTLFYDSPDGNLIIVDGKFVECNKAAETILKCDRSQIIGKMPSDISPEFQPNGRRSDEYAEELIRTTLAENKKHFEWLHKRFDGTLMQTLVSLTVIEFESRSAILTTWRDITEQRLAEESIRKLSNAVEQSPISIFITNIDGIIEYANPCNFKSSGYTSDELIGKNPRIFKSNDTPKEVYVDLWNKITTGNNWKGVLHNKRKNGELFWEQTSISPIKNSLGQITHFIAIKEDITERIKIEDEIKDLNQNLEKKITERTQELENSNQALENARTEAEQANIAKSEFLSRMSHELRTPMNAILGFAQLLEMGELNAGQVKGVKHILRSGKHLLDLINEVLDISRIEAGRVSISVEPVELNGIINEIVDTLTIAANAKSIKIINASSSRSNEYVRADRQRLKQIIINIANNAIKYNKEGGSVLIKVSERDSLANGIIPIRISVIDDGIGISKENLKKVYTPFERIGADNTNIEGTGLGLAVVKELTVLMGGTYGVESELGKGSEFWIELPKTINELERVKQNGELLAELPIIENKHGCLLYIEDNVSNVELVEEIISTKRSNINLIVNTYGRNAIPLAKEHKPSLILLDLNLPDMHGSEVMAMLSADPATKNIPVVIVSADAMSKQLEKLIEMGAKNYITKPIEIVAFLNIIDQYI